MVEKDVPLPVPRRPEAKYEWDDCTDVGDSFFVPDVSYKTAKMAVYTRNKRGDGVRFTHRVWEKEGVKGVRIWRTQ
jgi:hypothetical protein